MSHLHPLQPSAVYDTYWRFAAERQNVFFRRLSACPEPWTKDPVISRYKFTNAYRASDRVSQFLIRNVIYGRNLPTSHDEVFFRIILFKLFNKIETWNLLERAFDAVTLKGYNFQRYDAVLTRAMDNGQTIYSAAYIMPPGGSAFGHVRKHQNHLRLLEAMVQDGAAERLARLHRMQLAFDLLRAYPTIGDFLAYQFVTDINYSLITDFSEMDFVVPGPGAKDGIRKCFGPSAALNEAELIRLVADRQEQEFERLGVVFPSLWGRRLQLIDCQNLFCEVDKYARVAHPDVEGITGRARIKQRFSPSGPIETPWYPPKWQINDRIAGEAPRTGDTAAEGGSERTRRPVGQLGMNQEDGR